MTKCKHPKDQIEVEITSYHRDDREYTCKLCGRQVDYYWAMWNDQPTEEKNA